MATTNRPLAPHIQIYRPQLTSVLSFSHRVTGIALSAGSVLLVIWLITAAAGEQAFYPLQSFLGSWAGLALLFIWTYSLFYHLCNGIRHLLWDSVIGLELASVYLSGWIVVFASAILTAGAWIAASLMAP
ncbi:MAG TPA: succinate dehydrogenase, cytochrome b556 subunit [Gammaproteobacteria bacterium]|jgi:succinate dehydrogenase / fumarate reductase cytochrome b subunit|nr:succinate dehydrogenase, cytochrome b556 subunit [Gammaproteobacteria bacterium]